MDHSRDQCSVWFLHCRGYTSNIFVWTCSCWNKFQRQNSCTCGEPYPTVCYALTCISIAVQVQRTCSVLPTTWTVAYYGFYIQSNGNFCHHFGICYLNSVCNIFELNNFCFLTFIPHWLLTVEHSSYVTLICSCYWNCKRILCRVLVHTMRPHGSVSSRHWQINGEQALC